MKVLKQKNWTEAGLRREHFHRYDRKQFVVLARELPAAESPKRIKTTWDTLVANAGYMICYDAGKGKTRAKLDDYPHWPCEPKIFLKTYRKWDQKFPWKPNAAEKHLLDLGCKPYYKFVGVWAKKLRKPVWVQSLESLEPILIPAGGWVTIGIEGEPTSMTEAEFSRRYEKASLNGKTPQAKPVQSKKAKAGV